FAFSAILVKLAQTEGIPSLFIASSRLMIAAILLTPFVLLKHRANLATLNRKDLFLAFSAGIFLALHFISWVTSLEYTSVLISVVFVTSGPLWVAILEFIFFRAKLPKLVIMGLVVAIFGGLLIGFAGALSDASTVEIDRQRELIGGGLSLIGAMTIAVYLI